MEEADLGQVAELAASVFGQPWSRQGFADALPMENTCFLVAEEDGRILGYCGAYLAADEGEVINVAVGLKFQRRGIADALLKELLLEAGKKGASRFFLEVRVSNQAAIRLYEKNGFQKQGIRKGFYQGPKEDAYIMNRIEDAENQKQEKKC